MDLAADEIRAKEFLCLALDIDDKEEIINLVEELKDYVGYFKINSAFTKYGPELIKEIKQRGGKIFLDLKFHDIPNTIESYAKAVTEMGVDIFNIHASGGMEMMKHAKKGMDYICNTKQIPKPKLIAVTILTSIDRTIMNNELSIQGEVDSQVNNLAVLASESGMDGIVCSAKDLATIKKNLPKDFFFITPGIKGKSTPAGTDQKRVYGAADAIKEGSSLLVVGRAILNAEDRKKAAKEILKDIAGAL